MIFHRIEASYVVDWVQGLPDVMCGDGQAPVRDRKPVGGSSDVTLLSELEPDGGGA